MNTFSQVWVFSDTPSRLPELMNGAQALANQINTFVLSDADGAQAIQLGARDFIQKPLNGWQIESILKNRFEGGV